MKKSRAFARPVGCFDLELFDEAAAGLMLFRFKIPPLALDVRIVLKLRAGFSVLPAILYGKLQKTVHDHRVDAGSLKLGLNGNQEHIQRIVFAVERI